MHYYWLIIIIIIIILSELRKELFIECFVYIYTHNWVGIKRRIEFKNYFVFHTQLKALFLGTIGFSVLALCSIGKKSSSIIK